MEIADEEVRRPVRPRVGRTGFLMLAQLLLKRQETERPRYVTSSEDLDTMLHEADAVVLTGDEALRYAVDRAARGGAIPEHCPKPR
ncbi:hypothetical protein [Streptomyces hawaiiensis]|uniref:hypothetical protein n=1 Tax=Streptomyces hawaiiensis TaxID=67305 RepID=UPI00364A5D28